MLKQLLALALLAGAVTVAPGQDTIVYSSGPSFPFGAFEENGGAMIDFNEDGVPDFSFASGVGLCTADIPVSACTLPYCAGAGGTNEILRQFSSATFLRFGEVIGSTPPTNSGWGSGDQSAMVATFIFSQRYVTSGWGGALHPAGIGYLGIRFHTADGWHYGWVRVRETSSTLGVPVVVDWAYETRTDTPIRAGVIGAGGNSRQFTVNFSGGGNLGTLILTGDRLRCELTLNGDFAGAVIGGPSPAQARAKPVASFSPPLAERQFAAVDYTAFFGEVMLSRSQITQLLRGADYVSLDGGAVMGRISSLP